MAFADFCCMDCGKTEMLELPRPEQVELFCCVREPNAHGDCSDVAPSVYRRVWGAVSIGAVRGAGGSPGRYGASRGAK